TLEWLLDRCARESEAELDAGQDTLFCVTQSLDAMARGGIHDQVGGGFHRYSTDARWLVPHFEKMLYDNALLAPVYAKAAALTGEARFDRVARSTVDYLLREMRHPAGGFSSATDADSEGEEGRFFVWSHDGFADVVAGVGADVDTFADFFDVTPGGNWEGTNILHEPVDRARFCAERNLDLAAFAVELDRVRAALRERRDERVHPGLDDKVLTSWNALAVRALVLTGMHLGLPDHVAAAAETADFLLSELVVDGRLHHVWKDGHASVPAFLEDVAFLAAALLELYAATGELRWFIAAQRLAEDADQRFRDRDGGGYFATAHDAEALFTRPKDTWDNATPSGNSVMGGVAVRLAAYTGASRWRDTAEELVALFQGDAGRAPTGYGWFLHVCEELVAGPREVAIVGRPGEERERLVRVLWERPRTGLALAVAEPDDGAAGVVPLLADRGEIDGLPAAYVCRGFVCERPVTAPDDLRSLLRGAG
ncbi:MAG: thioredoxin domain-containing protein, partial [Nitriliruptorales bacterium]